MLSSLFFDARLAGDGESRSRWRLVGEQGAHFELDVRPEEVKKASERWSG